MARQTWNRIAKYRLTEIIGTAIYIKKDLWKKTAGETKSDLECLERRVRIAIDEIGREE